MAKIIKEQDDVKSVSLDKKLLLSIPEAAAYSGIGIHKLNELVGKDDCPFILRNGGKRMIKRKEFEDYLSKVDVI